MTSGSPDDQDGGGGLVVGGSEHDSDGSGLPGLQQQAEDTSSNQVVLILTCLLKNKDGKREAQHQNHLIQTFFMLIYLKKNIRLI